MVTKITINRSTIKENDNACATYIEVPGQCYTKETFINGILVEKYTVQDVQKIYLMSPVPKYSFEYDDIEIRCEHCEKVFPYSKLEEDWEESWDSYSNSERVCPYCYGWDCCEIELEKFDESMIDDNRNN